MKLLILDLCNYIDYPLGGQLSFVKNLIKAFGEDAKLVGVSTDKKDPIGVWTKRVLNGIQYDFFSVAAIDKQFSRPIIPARISSIFRLRPYIDKVLKSIDYDLIFVQAPELLFCLSEKTLAKTFMVLPGVENPLSIARYPLARNFQNLYDFFFMRKIDKVKYIFASADEKELKRFIDRSKGRISRDRIIKYPTRYESSIYNVKDKVEQRCHLNLPVDAKIFTTVGRLSWFKGWKLMIDSFEKVFEKNSNSYLYFLGDGEDREKIKSYVNNKGLEGNVILVGSQPPVVVASYLNASDVFIMGSYKEGWSTTLVEACACAVPCVITNFSSAEEMIKEGVNGFVVKERDVDLFATKMLEASTLDRNSVIDFNAQYKDLAVSRMRESIETIISK